MEDPEGAVGNPGLLFSLSTAVTAGLLIFRIKNDVRPEWGRLLWSLGLLVGVELLCFWLLPSYSGLILLILVSFAVHLTAAGQSMMLPCQDRAVLITGCDTGFGHKLAKTLDRAGVKVFAGVLDESGAGAQELKSVGSPQLHVLQLDVTDSTQIHHAYHHIKSHVGDAGLWGLVNNAGVLGYYGDGEILPMRIYRKCLDVNFLSNVEMTQVFLPLLRKAKGRIVNISSLAGAVPIPGFSAYGASKAAVTSFSGVMRQELSKWGIKVAVVQPAGFRTNILGSKEEWDSTEREILHSLSEEVRETYGEEYISSMQHCLINVNSSSVADLRPVLDSMQHALFAVKPKPLYDPGMSGWAIPFICRTCPVWLYDSIFTRMFVFGNAQPAGLKLST
ncbi:17-beta-hydroxysteroid dehydrogenase type 2 [Chanos chanos]|uniref:17-beta-hydroxysteroid dehydrogenase type 2 n=1 Tax=Chanos chanos TaxID=29144 RepID=A0A6J2WLH7_CHACN|nr:estradiol 17-beta-dehydrogenase 2-like [Chanos chanos]